MAKAQRRPKRLKTPPRTANRRAQPARAAASNRALLQLLRAEQVASTAVWNRLSPAQQQRLAWETASSRAHELRLAYPSLVAVGAGYRIRGEPTREDRKRAGTLPQLEFTREPCIILTVATKWKKRPEVRRGKERKGAIPECFIAYTDDPDNPGRRVTAAVPTDVRERQPALARPRAGHRGLIAARRSGLPGHRGILACAVTLPDRPGLFAIGAHHVLAMSIADGVPVDSAGVVLRSDNTRIGTLVTDPIGSILPGQIAFDAALARIDDSVSPAALRKATGNLTATDYWRDPGAFPEDCLVLVGPLADSPQKDTLEAVFTQRRIVFGDDPDEVVYFRGLTSQPLHPVMLEFHVKPHEPRSTLEGESGCPIVTADRSIFVGMHIGGVDPPSYIIWAIPSTDLFLASRWNLPSPPVLVPL